MNETDGPPPEINETDALLAESAAVGVRANHVATVPVTANAGKQVWWSTTNAMTMCVVLLVFALVILSLSAWLMRAGQSASAVLRVFGTILVIIMSTFLVVAGYNDQQIGAPLGLLGTIVG